jgi:putative membrane protein
MIVYEPNKNFIQDIGHLAKSWTMTKIVRSTLFMGLITAAVCVPMELLGWSDKIGMDSMVFSLLGVVFSILLVFRTNSAYDRWWEGRKQWGALVNNCRNLAIMTHATLPEEDKQTRHKMAVYISNFCIAFKEHLRKGTKLDELVSVSPEELAIYEKKSHVPNHISLQIHQLVQKSYKKGDITGEDILNFKPHTQSLLDILGACERIKKTPIPFSYAVYIKVFITAYSLMMPFALVPFFGYWTIPMVMFVFFAFVGIEMMAEEIEDPFGLDCNDLPTGTIAHAIKDNVFEILEAKQGHKHVAELYEKQF